MGNNLSKPYIFLAFLISLLLFVILGGYYLREYVINGIRIKNESSKYTVMFNQGVIGFGKFYLETLKLGTFGNKGVVVVENGENIRRKISKLNITFTDEVQHTGSMIFEKGGPTISAFSLSVTGTEGDLKFYVNWEELKRLSEIDRLRLVNRRLWLAIYYISYHDSENDFLEKYDDVRKELEKAPLEKINYFTFKEK